MAFEVVEQAVGYLAGDEDAAVVGAYVPAVIGCQVGRGKDGEMRRGNGAAVGVILAKQHREEGVARQHVDLLVLHEQLLYAAFFHPVEFGLREVGPGDDVGQQRHAGVEVPVEGVEGHIKVVARCRGLQPGAVIVECLGYCLGTLPGSPLFEHEQGECRRSRQRLGIVAAVEHEVDAAHLFVALVAGNHFDSVGEAIAVGPGQ